VMNPDLYTAYYYVFGIMFAGGTIAYMVFISKLIAVMKLIR